jgi:hypothetical protein
MAGYNIYRCISSSEMLRHVALVRNGISGEHSVSFIRVTRFGELGKTLAVTSNRCTLRGRENGSGNMEYQTEEEERGGGIREWRGK